MDETYPLPPPAPLFILKANVAPTQEAVRGSQETQDEDRQEKQNVEGDGRVQERQAPLGLSERPEGDVAQTGDGDRPQRERTIEEIRRQQETEQIRHDTAVAAEEARQRDLLADVQPYQIRVLLRGGVVPYLDMMCVEPWYQWLQRLQAFRGIAHQKGFIPLESIAFIVHLDAIGQPVQMSENVVAFKKP